MCMSAMLLMPNVARLQVFVSMLVGPASPFIGQGVVTGQRVVVNAGWLQVGLSHTVCGAFMLCVGPNTQH